MKESQCFFCSQDVKAIDYKDTELLRSFTSGQCKIIDPRYSAVCAHHQRLLAQAIKRSRVLGLLPFVRPQA